MLSHGSVDRFRSVTGAQKFFPSVSFGLNANGVVLRIHSKLGRGPWHSSDFQTGSSQKSSEYLRTRETDLLRDVLFVRSLACLMRRVSLSIMGAAAVNSTSSTAGTLLQQAH